ncbi:hypothetical protein LABALGNA3A7_14790 [Dellaglioa algida]|nr:hypothetical protein LABALGNA3A7_14790 [Dellaglioa algida]
MKKILTSTLLAATVLGAGLVVSGSASAADVSTATTDGSVTFVPGSGTKPIDPNPNPTDPGDPGDGGIGEGGTGQTGPLAIVYATKAVSFGLDESKDGNYAVSETVPVSAETQELKGSNFISLQVGDVRGTSVGWRLKVSGNQLTSAKYGELKGARLSFEEGENTLVSGTKGTEAVSVPVDNVFDEAGSTVLSATAGKGAGLNADKIHARSMTLTIPAVAAQADTYKTTLNWSLEDGPVA